MIEEHPFPDHVQQAMIDAWDTELGQREAWLKQKKEEAEEIYKNAMADIRAIESEVHAVLEQAETAMTKPVSPLYNLPSAIEVVAPAGMFYAQWDKRGVLWLRYPTKEEWTKEVDDSYYTTEEGD